MLILLIILLLVFGGGGYYMGPGIGYYGGGGISLILAIVILYLIFGRSPQPLDHSPDSMCQETRVILNAAKTPAFCPDRHDQKIPNS